MPPPLAASCTMTHPLQELLTKLRSLEPFPQVALKVLAMSRRAQIVPDELVEVIQTDPGVIGKVLKLANSSYYGVQTEVVSLKEAGNLLGVQALVNLVMTTCAQRYMSGSKAKSKTSEDLYMQATATAIASRLLALKSRKADAEHAYTAGLLQNLGQVVIARHMGDARQQIQERVREGRSLLDAEREVFGLPHNELGARLASRWALPEVLVDTIRYHHAPEEGQIDLNLCRCAHLAEVLCRMADAYSAEDAGGVSVSVTSLTAIGFTREGFAALVPQLERDLESAKDFMSAA